ncbi:fumarylacetoacetate hydrolase family protein [Saxibacter everestensis]|uniref:Fumarylacetoacetate hydrolase family protein n=1 Tax=Saxibacter everestensis TaxID=2909229 RepID=A0ABY8QTZ3_9MICO|nr:fumarylacetoacetate hydrolase family protein [Brevibacteriaceae bacterium ZFBP1038]
MTETFALTAPFALARRKEDGALGLVAGDQFRPLMAKELGAADLNAFLAAPDWDRLAALAAATDGDWAALESVTLAAPVTPRQVIQAGANYRQHVIDLVAGGLTRDTDRTPEQARESAAAMMDDRKANGEAYFFIGLTTALVGAEEPLVLPPYSEEHDWELELAVVIGAEACRVSREDAWDHVAGYTIVNDITTRDLVFRKDMKEIGTDWFRAKNAPGFLPTGPYLVPARYADGSDLGIRLTLNGEVMQDARTDDLLFDIPALIATASQTRPLLPGDVLLTGSPTGNGTHWKRYLRDGDVMVGSIEGLGAQTVRCVAERGANAAMVPARESSDVETGSRP